MGERRLAHLGYLHCERTEDRHVNVCRSRDRAGILDVDCDIFIPAARPDVVREDNVARLQVKLVLQGADIPFTPGAAMATRRFNIM